MLSAIPSYNGPQSPFDTHSPSSAVSSYSPSALASVIHAHSGSRVLRWRFDLCTNNRRWGGSDGSPAFKSDLTPFVSRFTITQNSQQPVQRSLQLDMLETAASQTVTISGGAITAAGVDYLNDLVMPVALIQLGPSEWAHFRLGVFAFTRPQVQVLGYAIVRTGTMPDLTRYVQQAFATDPTNITSIPFVLPQGASVQNTIARLLYQGTAPATAQAPGQTMSQLLDNMPGCALGDLLPSNAFGTALSQNTPGNWPTGINGTFASDYQVSEGTSYLDLINHLAKTINCYPLYADERGIFRLQQPPLTILVAYPDTPIIDYTSASAQWTYDTTSNSIVQFGVSEDILIDDIANVVQVRVEDGFRTPYLATAINVDASSPYNVTNWGGSGQARRIVRVIDDGQIPGIAIDGTNYAKEYAVRELLMASWLVDQVTLPIAVNPVHCGGTQYDVIALNIYQTDVAAGTPQSVPVVATSGFPGLLSTENFVLMGWTITGQLPMPGSAANVTGNTGVTVDLSSREGKPGSSMTLTCNRVTTTLRPSGIQVEGVSG